MNNRVLMHIVDWNTRSWDNPPRILTLDVLTLHIHYYNKEHEKQLREGIQKRLKLSNLQLCVFLDNLNNYKEKDNEEDS